MPLGIEKSMVDGAIAISEVFPELSHVMDHLESIEPIANSGIIGVGWSTSGGESAALLNEKYLAADGIENVIRVLEEIEDERIGELDFIELNACAGGCVGGVLCVENPYVAKARIQRLRKYLPVSQNHLRGGPVPEVMEWNTNLEFSDVLTLSSDLKEAMQMMARIDEIEKEFGINVGKQLNVMTGLVGGTVAGISHNDRGIMSDEEYYRRYGHPRGVHVANFLRGAK